MSTSLNSSSQVREMLPELERVCEGTLNMINKVNQQGKLLIIAEWRFSISEIDIVKKLKTTSL